MAEALLGGGRLSVGSPVRHPDPQNAQQARQSRQSSAAAQREGHTRQGRRERGDTLDMVQAWRREVYKTGQEILEARSNVGGERSTAPRSEVTGSL
jgi:hypothetical protein